MEGLARSLHRRVLKSELLPTSPGHPDAEGGGADSPRSAPEFITPPIAPSS